MHEYYGVDELELLFCLQSLFYLVSNDGQQIHVRSEGIFLMHDEGNKRSKNAVPHHIVLDICYPFEYLRYKVLQQHFGVRPALTDYLNNVLDCLGQEFRHLSHTQHS